MLRNLFLRLPLTAGRGSKSFLSVGDGKKMYHATSKLFATHSFPGSVEAISEVRSQRSEIVAAIQIGCYYTTWYLVTCSICQAHIWITQFS